MTRARTWLGEWIHSFGRVGETSKSGRKYPRGDRQTLPPIWRVAVDSKVITMATQVGLKESENPPTSNKHPHPTTKKSVGGKCYSCGSAHRIERCPDFINTSVRESIILRGTKDFVWTVYVGDILLVSASHHLDANNVSSLTIPCCTKQQKTKRVQVWIFRKSQIQESRLMSMPQLQNLLHLLKQPATHIPWHHEPKLQVVPVKIMNNDGRSVTTYAFLDTGSEETFLSKTISDRLGLEVNNCNTLAVCTLLGEFSVRVGQANVQVKAVDNHEDRTLRFWMLTTIRWQCWLVPKCMKNVGEGDQESHMPFERYLVGLCLDQWLWLIARPLK